VVTVQYFESDQATKQKFEFDHHPSVNPPDFRKNIGIHRIWLCWPGSPIILVFDPERRYQIPRGTPSARAQNTSGWENFAIFHRNRRLSRKRYEIGPWLLWNVNRKSYALYRMVTFSMIFTDP